MRDAQDDSTTRVYSPAEVAKLLEVSPTTVRRMARAYERTHDRLPRDNRDDRLWPHEAVETLQAARAMREAGKAASLEAALEALASGEVAPSVVLEQARAPEPWELVLGELRALREEVKALREQNEILQEHLALPKPVEKRRWWWPWWL